MPPLCCVVLLACKFTSSFNSHQIPLAFFATYKEVVGGILYTDLDQGEQWSSHVLYHSRTSYVRSPTFENCKPYVASIFKALHSSVPDGFVV